ncbi:MAG: hypothetical protein QW677_04790 [Pyrobaculum sp.]|uniref:hypothetical protein n=1 Tax=Pyrobaculum TaxID=2276 RepID=UPI0015F29F68|nr:hypothetical protein [Pyrobaculum aerophilum]
MGFALSGIDKAERPFGQAAEISKGLGDWKSYLTDRNLALRARAVAFLPERAER